MADSKMGSGRPTYATNFITTDIDKVALLGNPLMDSVITTLMAMGNEVWTVRKRQYVLEALLAEKGVKQEAIEQFTASAEQEKQWKKEREVLVERLYGHFALNTGEFTFVSDWHGK